MLTKLYPLLLNTGTRLFSLAESVRAVSVTRLFGFGRSGLETFRSGYESCRNILCSLFNANRLKSTKGFILKNYKHDPRSNS